MKRNFIKFPARPTSFLPKIESRRFGAQAAYRSEGEDAAAKEALLTEIKSKVGEELNTRGYQNKEAVDAALNERMKQFEGMELDALRAYKTDKEAIEKKIADQQSALEAQGLELRALKDAQTKALPDRKTIASQIRSFMDKNKDKWAQFKSGEIRSFGTDKEGNSAIELNERAAITMTIGASTGGSVFVPTPEVMPGLVDLARNKPFLENYSNTSNTGSARIVWTEKYNPQGNADFIGEGEVKPLISFEIRNLETYAKKVADKIKVSTEMLEDIDFIAAEIENELRYKVDIAVDDALLNGAGDGSVSATDIKGLDASIGVYVLTTITTDTPNDFDAIRAAIAQIVSLNFNPNALFINPIDGANMDLVKDSQGRPLAMEYKDPNGRIFRVMPIETNQIPVGYFLLGDMTRFKVRNYKPFSVSYGWVNDDFEKNLVTVIGERRLHAFVAVNDTGAFIYDTFANVKTAITATP